MDYSRLISAIFRDKPGVMYENPPPPSDYSEDEFEPVFYTYPRPQSVKLFEDMRFIKIDRNLIHKSLLGCEEKEDGQISTEPTTGNENRTGNENIEDIEVIEIEESSAEVPLNKNVLEKEIGKKKKKERKQRNRSTGERKNDTDSDDSKNSKEKNVLVIKSSALQSISKSYSISESDSDDSEKHRTKSSSHLAKSHSKKSYQRRRKHRNSRNDSSYIDVTPYDELGLRSAKFSVEREISSCDNETCSSSFLNKGEITVKDVELSDKDNYKKDKIDTSKRSNKRYEDSRNRDNSKNCDNSRDRHNSWSSDDSRSRNDSWSRDESRSQFGDSRSPDDTRNRFDDSQDHDDARTNADDYRKNHSDYSSDDDSRKRHHDDSNGSIRGFNSYIQKETIQEPGGSSWYQSKNYYCDICKLVVKSEKIFNSHMAGKRHKKALKLISEKEAAKSLVLKTKESQNFPKLPDVECIQLHEEQSKIQEICENTDLLIVGLDHVREARGYDDTKYFCDLCDAQCDANSIIKHLAGYKHQMNCLKTYCYQSFCWVKTLDKRERKAEKELKLRLKEIKRLHGKGRIKVFKDVIRNQRNPEHLNLHQPSTSKQAPLPENVQGKSPDDQKVTDEDCLSKDYLDFYCKVCDSHMNNFAMWESHARGKKHAKNKKKAEEGARTNDNFIEAPQGTISHLEELINEQCDPNDIIIGLNFIRENQGDNGYLYNCFLCGSVCTTIDIIDHLHLKKHKTKYLEKMLSDGHQNAINEINSLPIGESAKEGLIDSECGMMLKEHGRGKVVIALTKKTF